MKEQLYIKGFNNGYIIAQHEPALLKKIMPNYNHKNDYIDGLVEGSKEWELENIRSQLSELKQLRNRGNEKENILGEERE